MSLVAAADVADELLTTEEAADLIGVTANWVATRARRGELAHIRKGPLYLIPRAAAEAEAAIQRARELSGQPRRGRPRKASRRAQLELKPHTA